MYCGTKWKGKLGFINNTFKKSKAPKIPRSLYYYRYILHNII